MPGRDFDFVQPWTARDLVEWRTRLSLRQEDAAALLDVSDRTIQSYEIGERTIPGSKQIACMAFEYWTPLRMAIDRIILARSARARKA